MILHDDGAHGDGNAGDAAWANTLTDTAQQGVYQLLFRSVGRNARGELAPRLIQRYVTLQHDRPGGGGTGPGDGGGDDPRGCPLCGSGISSYLIGSFDLRQGGRFRVDLMNPTPDILHVLVAIFDQDGQPLRCERSKIAGNGLLDLELSRLDLQNRAGVVKVVSLDPVTGKPVVGLAGNQIRVTDRGIGETGLHPVPGAILDRDMKQILSACR